MPVHQRTHVLIAVEIIKTHLSSFTIMPSKFAVYAWSFSSTTPFQLYIYHIIMNVNDYWPMAREYSVWNATVAALQFWTADLKAHVLSSVIEQVYNAFFYSTSTHILHQQSDEVLFSHFMTTLNAAFESKLTLKDEGYESSSENFNIPTPLRRTFKIHHVSSNENFSFDPATPCSTGASQSHHKPVQCWLTFNSSDDEDTLTVDSPSPSSIVPLQDLVVFLQQPPPKCTLPICDDLNDDEEEEEDFQTVSLEDDHWTMEEILDRYLCIHEHSLPHDYAHTHAHIWITHLHHTMTPWISVTFLSLKIWWLHPAMKTFLP